jgi:hypothetical protein
LFEPVQPQERFKEVTFWLGTAPKRPLPGRLVNKDFRGGGGSFVVLVGIDFLFRCSGASLRGSQDSLNTAPALRHGSCLVAARSFA